jgi:tetratricopeptide (TPR) repeat protein
MTAEALCPGCSQRLKPEWVRCPRCRLWLGEQQKAAVAAPRATTTAVEVETPSGSLTPWVLAAVLLLGVGVAVVVMSSGTTAPAPVTPATTVRGTTPTESYAPTRGREIDSAALTKNVTSDILRAGQAAYAKGDFVSALAQFESAVATAPNDADARNNLGQVLVRQARVAEAMPHFDEAIRIDPTRWAFRFNRARAYGLLNRLPEAVADYQTAAQLFPEDYATHYNLGLTLMQLKRYPEAVASLEQAVAMAPGEPSFLISLGTALVGARQQDKAKAVFQQFLELAPNDPEAPRVKALISAMDAASAR